MRIRISAVYKWWLDANSASNATISLPRSHVQAQAALTAVTPGGRAWTRIADMRSGAFLAGGAPFGTDTTLTADTDLLALQVFTDGEATAAAAGTVLFSPIRDRLDVARPMRSELAELAIVERSAWILHTDHGTVRAVHTHTRLEGAEPLSRDELTELLTAGAPERLHVIPVEEAVLQDAAASSAKRLRVDPSGGLVIE